MNGSSLYAAWWCIVSSWNVNYTIALATSIYALIAILQWRALRKTVRETQDLLVTANRQARAAEDQVANLEKTLAATEIAADAARKSADAVVATSDAYVHLMRVSIEGLVKGKDIMEETVGVADPFFCYGFTNYGKTPAFLTEVCWEYRMAARLPEMPIYENRGPMFEMLVIPAEEDVDVRQGWSHIFGKYLTEDDIAPVRKMQIRLFVYGYIKYRNVFDRHTSVGFAYWIDAKGVAHVVAPDVAPAYTYRRSE